MEGKITIDKKHIGTSKSISFDEMSNPIDDIISKYIRKEGDEKERLLKHKMESLNISLTEIELESSRKFKKFLCERHIDPEPNISLIERWWYDDDTIDGLLILEVITYNFTDINELDGRVVMSRKMEWK